MDIAKQYEQLAAKLGDITYKLLVLEKKRKEVIAEIKQLDEIAGLLNAQTEKANAAKRQSRNDSPA